MTSTAHLTNQQLKKRNKWMFKLHVLTNELLDWASRVYSMYSKGQAHKPEVLEQIYIQISADMIGHLRKKLEAEGYSVWNAITYRHHQEFVDDLAYNNRKMKQDIAFKSHEMDSKQEQINNLLEQLKEEQRLRLRDVSQVKGELEAQIDSLNEEVKRLKKDKDGLLNRYIIETNTTQRYSNKVEKLENEVEELGSNLEVVMNRRPKDVTKTLTKGSNSVKPLPYLHMGPNITRRPINIISTDISNGISKQGKKKDTRPISLKFPDKNTKSLDKNKDIRASSLRLPDNHNQDMTTGRNKDGGWIKSGSSRTIRFSIESDVDDIGSNSESSRYPPVSSRSREAVTREMLLETRIARLQKENDSLLNRLTEAETKTIRNGYPDLEPYAGGHENQGPLFPQRVNSLYVDEWTNGYEVVKNVYGERKSVIVLMEWFETCQKLGKDLFIEQREMLKSETVGFLRNHQKTERKDIALPVSKDGVVHIKDFQRKMAADTIPAFKEVCRINTIKSIRFKGRNAALDYINKCAELCWMMNFEDPPVALDFDVKEGSKLNTNRFNTYFKKGKLVDYLVWPVLMSLSDNTIITKGIVQCKQGTTKS